MLREPTFGDGDFSIKKFEERYNSDLANGLGNLVSRVLTLNSKINTDTKPEKDILSKTKEIRDNYTKYIENFKLFEALNEIWKLIAFCDEYIDKNKPWELDKNAKNVLSNMLYCISEIADLILPFLPETSEKIKKQLKSNKPEILFPRC